MSRACAALVVLAVLCAAPRIASAHAPSDAHVYLAIDDDHIAGRIDVALRNLDTALGLDRDGDGNITWAEVTAAEPRIAAYVDARFALASEAGACPRRVASPALVNLSDGTYWAQPFTASCAGGARPRDLVIRYNLLFDLDAQHQGLIHIADAGATQTLIVRDAQPVTATLAAATSFAAFAGEGVRHVGAHLDHLLFLLCLVLPAVYQRRAQHRAPADSLRDATLDAAEIVAAFVLASAITLALSASGLVQLPPRFVAVAIALSVVAAGGNNLARAIDRTAPPVDGAAGRGRAPTGDARWAIAFALGLVHGFGLSAALLDLGATHELRALLGFDLGTDLALAASVLVALPLLYAIRRTPAYQLVLWAGSGAAAVVALAALALRGG